MSGAEYDAHLRFTCRRVSSPAMKFSWELGAKPFVPRTFSALPCRGPLPPVLSVPVPKQGPAHAVTDSVAKMTIGRLRSDRTWVAHLEARHRSAIQRLRGLCITERAPLSGTLPGQSTSKLNRSHSRNPSCTSFCVSWMTAPRPPSRKASCLHLGSVGSYLVLLMLTTRLGVAGSGGLPGLPGLLFSARQRRCRSCRLPLQWSRALRSLSLMSRLMPLIGCARFLPVLRFSQGPLQ